MRRAIKQSPLKPLPKPKVTRVERMIAVGPDQAVPDMLTILHRAVGDIQRQKMTKKKTALSPRNINRRRARGFPHGR